MAGREETALEEEQEEEAGLGLSNGEAGDGPEE